MTISRVTDRSRIIQFQRCPRSRYWNYEWGGVGLQKIRASVPLATGTHVHTGLADMLRGCDIEDVVGVALEGYEREVKDRGLELEPGEDASYVADEQRAWIEAILRVAAIHWLPRFKANHEILEVEHEELWENFVPGIDLMARTDALVRETGTDDLYVVSFKTAAKFDRRTEQGNRHDVQGLSEVAVIEHRLASCWCRIKDAESAARQGREHPDVQTIRTVFNGETIELPAVVFHEGPNDCGTDPLGCDRGVMNILRRLDAPPRILGVRMIYFLKGRREEYPEGSGNWITWSPLIRGWYNEGVTGAEYAFRFQWSGPDTNPDTGKLRVHRLGRGWQKFETFGRDARMTVKEWVELLASGQVQPDAGDPFASEIVEPPAYFRNDQEMQDWIEQIREQERRTLAEAGEIERLREAGADASFRRALNTYAPQFRHSCCYPSNCQFIEICFGSDSSMANPLGTGLYRLRVPHHAPEVDRLDTLASASASSEHSS